MCWLIKFAYQAQVAAIVSANPLEMGRAYRNNDFVAVFRF